jgi:branched-chain amino acid transport system substrate-binding protein
LTTEDGLCTPEGGATAASKLAADTSLVALVGSSCSDETVGGIAAITNAGLTTISPSNTRPALTDPSRGADYAGYLRTAHSDAFQGKAVAEFAYNSLGVRKAATIHDGSAYAQALQQVFADNFTALGGEIVAQEAVAKDATDMRPVLTSIAAKAPEFLYYPVFIAAGGFLTAQVREIAGLEDVKIAGSDGIFSPELLKGGGPNTEGMYLSSPDFGAFPEGYAAFIEKHKAKYGGPPPSTFHAHAYDATGIIFAALEKVAVIADDGTINVPRKALRDAIYATKDYKGITGTLSCSPSGDCGAPVIAVYEIVNSDPASWNPQVAANPNPKKVYP